MAGEKILSLICCVLLCHTVRGSNISGLYFQLNDKVYLPGESINILEIGQQPPSRFDSGSTLICMTANINTACCRNSDGASVGSWYYPNRTEVPRPSNNYYSHFYRIGHTHQVRLTRQNNVLGPLGRYTCSVPDPQGRIWSATIIITRSTNLYFQLNGNVYLPGEAINVFDVGFQPNNRSDPGSTLICMTEGINRECCRSTDGANVGNWYYPNGTKVPRPHEGYSLYHRIGHYNQVRLLRSHDAVGTLGNYTCSVPDQQGLVWSASIFIIDKINISLTMTRSIVMTGESVSFNCSIHSRQFNGIIIRFVMPNGTIVKSSSNSSQGSTIVYTISSVQLSHSGQYKCNVGQNFAKKEVYVKLQPPVSVVLLLLTQPIYATSTLNISYHIQLLHIYDEPSYFNIQWTSPIDSSQMLRETEIPALGRNYFEGFTLLPNVGIEDHGRYTCQVQMTSQSQYVLPSNVTLKSINIIIKDVPIISVTVTNTNEATLGGVYLLICSSTSLEINFIYTSTFQWYHNGAILVGRNPRVLHLSSLALSDVGNYTCRVTATSRALGQPIVTDSLPHTVILRAPNPLSLQLSAAPTLVFEGFSLLLTCVTTFSSNVNVNLMVETELNGPSITITREAMVLSTSRYEASFTIPNITSNHTGNYSCFSIASGISISPSSLYKSNNIPINPVSHPSTPMIIDVISKSTSIYFIWNVIRGDLVQHFQLTYSYNISGCLGLGGRNVITLNNNTQNYNITSLEENSNFSIALMAVNQAGSSFPAIIRTTTRQAAPARPPANLTPTVITSTSITMAWDPVPCSHRNTDITGYNVVYSIDLNHSDLATNLGTTNTEFVKATGLIPRTSYTFFVTPLHNLNNINPNGSLTATTTISPVMEFYLNGKTLLNNSILLSSAIGKNKDALFCLTNFSDCCKYPIIKGQWIFPNQTDVLPLFYGNSFYRSRHSSSIILHQKSTDGLNSHTGIYTCSIPDSSEKYQNLYIHIADYFSDLYISEVFYNRDLSHINCVSSGRPVHSWEWLKDGIVIEKNNYNFYQSEIISNYTAPTYIHSLSSEDVVEMEGRFTCLVTDSDGNTDRKTIMINNCHPGKYGAVAFDGSTVCVPCPANSMSTSVGSNGCGCLLGYYRNHLEDKHFPCTRSPSNCRGLRVTEESYGSAVLEWSRPYIPGRHDLYYNVYISNSGKYVKFNNYPVVSDSARVQYILTGLRPLTNYQVKVTVSNGVSENYESTEGGACELSWTTSNNTLHPPQSVSAVCGMVAWQAPSVADYKFITGYEVHISLNQLNENIVISKKYYQLFHRIFQDGTFPYNANQNFTAVVKVRGRTSTAAGAWSKSITMSCPQ